jgi:hypothetical protein
MNTLKYILTFIFVFLIQLFVIETKSFSFSKESSYFFGRNDSFRSIEEVYANPFYYIENDKFAATSYLSVFALGFSLRDNTELVESWKRMLDAPEWSRKNADLLELISNQRDDVAQKVADFYKTTMKNQTPAGFNGGEKIYGGVWYNKYGFPDFEKLNQTIGKKYNFNGAKGNYDSDFSEARDWLKKQEGIEAIDDYNGTGSPLNVKIDGKWKKITWHHHEDGSTLVPVFTDVHTGLPHTGGVKTTELGINHLFNY